LKLITKKIVLTPRTSSVDKMAISDKVISTIRVEFSLAKESVLPQPKVERRECTEIKRRDFLKSGVAILGAASLGMTPEGMVRRKNVAKRF